MPAKITSILKKLLNQPTAPFHEYLVRAEIEQMLLDVPHVELEHDSFGNLLVTYRKGKRRQEPVWVVGAHMDHPAYVKSPKKSGEWEFLGGVPKHVLDTPDARKLMKPVGDMAIWDFPTKIDEIVEDGVDDGVDNARVEAPACDDLVGCAIIVCLIKEISRLGLEATFHAVFTRAEEVGFLGAWHLGKNWPFGEKAVFLSLETSRPVNGAEMGEGPIVRVGDRLSVFDGEIVSVLVRTAGSQGIRIQRCLLDAGACEASALQACGIRSGGISVPLGNYHNLDDDDTLQPEYVMLSDVTETLKLLVALVGTDHQGLGERTIEERVTLRMKEFKKHHEAGDARFAEREA